MSAAGKAKAKGKAKAQAKAVAAPTAPEQDPANTAHLQVVKQAIEQIEQHPLMAGIREAPPIARGAVDPATGKAGYKDVFTQAKLSQDLQNAGMSEQAGNFFWQDSFLVPLAGVPLNPQSVAILRDRNFKEPVAFPDKLVVAASGPEYDAGSHLGAWQHITPEEIIHAYILAAARDVSNHKKMKAWRFHMLTVTFSFVIAVGEEIHWKQARLREDVEVAYRVVTRSALQRIYEINMVLARRAGNKTLSYSQLAETYQKHLQMLDSQEKISASYITEAVRLYKSLLSDASVRGGCRGRRFVGFVVTQKTPRWWPRPHVGGTLLIGPVNANISIYLACF